MLGYLLQASVLWLLHWHFVQNTLLSQHCCCFCPCFPHRKHIGNALLPSVLSVCTGIWLQWLVAAVTHVGWLLLEFMYACSFVTMPFWPVALVSCNVNSVSTGLFQWMLYPAVCWFMWLGGAVDLRMVLTTDAMGAPVLMVLCCMGVLYLLRWLASWLLDGVLCCWSMGADMWVFVLMTRGGHFLAMDGFW